MTAWLGRNAPGVLATLGGPGDQAAIDAAEVRMGLELPSELRQWILLNDVRVGGAGGFGSCLVTAGSGDVIPDGGLLLGLTDIERVHVHMTALAEAEPSGDPGRPLWRREWLPIVAERDGFHGTFLNARTGTMGSWSEGSSPEDGEYPSLAAFFQHVADRLEGVPSGDRTGPAARRRDPRPQDEPVRRWARANGFRVSDRGRVPSALREAYEASL
ncbi:histone-like nucleoid-structuring protein Lsr2 [Streptomyces sp. CBMA156]|uniref:Lsr2 family DNA-binding protein n=1 Tax=Streptomyces sp. CBMA156 TaxID=1930280 RepID=UPI001D911CA7|nr:histone-like nucleoid-structuring protein Lsr2 [Streptomyces sp. CBMA156]MBD0676455.1 hypothetical protein [Streptomyces sp. CBMA156]